MATSVIYKNVRIGDEASWGTSAMTNPRNMIVRTISINTNPNKALVEDTMVSNKGHDSMVWGKSEIDGDIDTYVSPRNINNLLKYTMGGIGATAAVGTSAIQITYNPDTSGNLSSFTLVQDRNASQEVFYGVRASKLSLKGANDLIEATMSVMARTRGTGPSIADIVGETIRPFIFADATITVGLPGFTQTSVLNVAEWNLDYTNNAERTFLSGSRDAARIDAKIPDVEGSFKIFHTGNSYVSPTFGVSELYLRIELTANSTNGLIAGVTPAYLRIDVPKIQFVTNERNYEAAQLSMETISFKGIWDAGTSLLMNAQLVAGFDIEA